ncbi:PKD domain-containing protein, partial [Flavobacterium cauense]
MRKIYLLFLMLLSIGAMAQVPSNDACSNALAVALPASGSVCFNSSNINATSNGSITCDTAGPGKEVWYTFIATNSNNSVTVTPNGASPISNVVVTLMTGGCGAGTYDMCNSGTGSNPVTSTVGLVPGTQVWVSVESNGGGTGDFQVCINSTPPSSSPGDGCASASNVCDKSSISYPDLTGFTASGVQPACFAAAVRKDVWIKFTVGVTGTLEFLGTPIAADEYDWALYDVTSGCLGTLVSCNYNYASAGPFSCGIPGSTFGMLTTTTGQPCAAEFNAPITVTAGRTYALLIDNYSQTNSGFTLDWGGTFQMGTTASFTATPQSSCSVPLVVTITNNSVGASTYQWNFGDGSTSTSPNPGTHTYTSTGDYLISLVVTGNGCTSVMSKRINLNTGPVIAVTPASQTICPGDSVNLNGVLSLGTPYNDRLFTNNVNTAIPNNNAAGLTNALTTSGMLNTTLTTGSVQSICFTINHSDHSDIGRGPTPTAVQVTVNGNTYNFTPLPLPAVSGTATYCFPQAVLNAINAAGGNANTTWTLKVADNRGGGGGTGSLVSWEVVLRDFNSITGYSWSPTTNMANSTTLTPTVTPVSSTTYVLSATDLFGCSTSLSVPITVNAGITPTFTAVAPICSGGTLSALPTTSNNGVTGTWSPALNNTATTVYTFNPTAGQCASTVTMTITVNPNVTPTFTAVAPICSGAALSALPTTSNNSIIGTWSPALNNTATTVYTFTPTAGQCATTTTMTITVNPNVTPTFTAVAPICSGAALSALPTTSNNGITGTWSPALNNTATTVYTFTPTAGQCATTTTMTITVNPNVTPTFTAVAP